MNRIAIIDYGMGNLRSVVNAFRQAAPEAEALLTSDPAVVDSADRVVFPGQGAMPDCMARLKETGLDEAVKRAATEKPFLGICIGLQMIFSETEEGHVTGLDLLPGKVKRFPADMVDEKGLPLKVPQIGWNRVRQDKAHPLWTAIPDGSRFYFVHSYYPLPDDDSGVVGTTTYGFDYASAVARGNVFAIQCHPEKSGPTGLRLLYNFAVWQPFLIES